MRAVLFVFLIIKESIMKNKYTRFTLLSLLPAIAGFLFIYGTVPSPKLFAAGETLHVYMAPGGKDTNSGLSQENPVRKLTKVQEIVSAKTKTPATAKNVVVHVGGGIYKNETVKWKYYMLDKSITFQGSTTSSTTFDGSNTTPIWFAFTTSNTDGLVKTNLIFTDITVKHYLTAMYLHGGVECVASLDDKDCSKKANGYNTIKNMSFIENGPRIVNGNVYPEYKYAQYVIGLSETKYNIIENNVFKDNTGGIHTHSIYANNFSSDNTIKYNMFDDMTVNLVSDSKDIKAGDSIRFRNQSNNNLVQGNVFKNSGVFAPVSAWYCNGDASDACVNATDCPAVGNTVKDNTMTGDYNYGTKKELMPNYNVIAYNYGKGQDLVKGASCIKKGNVRGIAFILENNKTGTGTKCETQKTVFVTPVITGADALKVGEDSIYTIGGSSFYGLGSNIKFHYEYKTGGTIFGRKTADTLSRKGISTSTIAFDEVGNHKIFARAAAFEFTPSPWSAPITVTVNQISEPAVATPSTSELAVATPSSVLGASSYKFTQTMTIGWTGDEVSALQDTLRELGYYSGDSTRYFGAVTQSAVQRFQSARGIESTGIVGPLTRALLNDGVVAAE